MKISKSTKIMSGLGALATILVFGGENTTAMQHHHKSIIARVHTHAHAHLHWHSKDKAIHDHWAMGEILKQHGKEGDAKDVLAHMHRPEVEAQ